MFDHKRLLDEILITRNGIQVDSIHFVSDEIFEKEENEQLLFVGLESYEPIYFSVKGLNYSEKNGLQSFSKMRGATICVKNDLNIDQVIFLQKEVRKALNIPIESQNDWKSMVQLCALLHELGHVEDMQKTINFSLSEAPTVKLIEAEAYAHTYTLNYLNRIGATSARDTLAGALYKLIQSKRKFEKSLIQQVFKSIGKGRIKKWATA